MNRIERDILLAETNGVEPHLSIQSNTRIDTGRWWRLASLWVCVTGEDVIILAANRRRYVHRLPISACGGSHYCHTTGELVIDAGDLNDDLEYRRLALSPVDALRVLRAMNVTDKNDTSLNSNELENTRA